MLRHSAFRGLARVVLRYKGLYAASILSQLILTGIALAFAETSRRLFNLVPHIPKSALTAILTTLVLLTAARFCFGFVSNWIGSLLNESVAFDLRRQVLHHLQYLPLGFHESGRSSDMYNLVNTELEITKDVLVNDIQRLITLPISFVATATYLLSVHPLLALIALGVGPLQLLSSLVLTERYQDAVRAKVDCIRDVFFLMEETLQGIREVKANQMEPLVDARMAQVQQRGIAANVMCTRLESIRSILRDMPRECGFTVGVAVGAIMMASNTIGAGGLIAFITLLDRVSGTFTGLVGVIGNLQRSVVGAARLYDVMERAEEAQTVGLPLGPEPPSITFDGVTFAYDEGRPVLSNVSFFIPPGSIVALVGPSGGGKSTVVKLLYRFYDSQEGAIRVNGILINQYSIAALRSRMALVSQDLFLFDASIGDNIAAGRPDATMEEVARAADIAQASGFIASLPAGLDTAIGQRGAKLSHGQRQRLSIARAVLRGASLLILDEPTSALDVETEASFQEDLGRWADGCTKVVIAHRLSTIRNANYVLFIDEGRVVEAGTPADLLKSNGRFWQFWQRQELGLPTGVAGEGLMRAGANESSIQPDKSEVSLTEAVHIGKPTSKEASAT